MRFVRRAGLALAATAVSIGLLGAASTTAHADTSWGQKFKRTVPTETVEVQPLDTSWGMK